MRSLVYRESATVVVVSHVESDLHEHANGCRKKRTRTSSASSAAHTRYFIKRACDKTAYRYIGDVRIENVLEKSRTKVQIMMFEMLMSTIF